MGEFTNNIGSIYKSFEEVTHMRRGVLENQRRRLEAEERQVVYDGLTAKQKVQRLDDGNFRAIKERAKLAKEV